MSERTAVIVETDPGIVHVSTEALCALMERAGGRRVEPSNGGDIEYVFRDKPKHEARKPHPDTMAGK